MKMDENLCQTLTTLLHFQSYKKIANRCTGKWRGTIDYSLVFDNKIKLFISNGMENFNSRVKSISDDIISFKENKANLLIQLKDRIIHDNKIASKIGLYEVEILDVDICTDNELYCTWPYIHMRVNGIEFFFVETGLKYALYKNNLAEYLKRKMPHISTASAVEKPTFIFSNIKYSHIDELYKIPTLDD